MHRPACWIGLALLLLATACGGGGGAANGVGSAGGIASPAFTPPAGTFTSPQDVSLATSTAGATIRYTTDGSTPTATSGTPYSGSIRIDATTTVKAVAFKEGSPDSPVATATYSITGTVAAPTFDLAPGSYATAQSVTLSTGTSGATIRYTTDGSTPSPSSGTVYTTAIPLGLNSTTTIKAIAFRADWAASPVVSGMYTITGIVAAPTFNIPAGTYTASRMIILTTLTPGATIRYTTDGSTPTPTTGTVYSTAILLGLNSATTIKAIAFKAGWTDSPLVTGAYTITGTVAPPAFGVAPGTYSTPRNVALSTATPGATIRYTTDGSTPSEITGTVYAGPIALGTESTTTIKAIAYRADWASSGITSGTYTITGTVAMPSFSPTPQSYIGSAIVTLSTTTGGAAIRYTTNGTTPSATAGTLYTSPFTVSSTCTIRAVAYRADWADSPVAAGTYTITGVVSTPVFNISPGTYTTPQGLSITTTTPGATIRYTTDGTPPSPTHGMIFGSPIGLFTNSTTTIRAIAYRDYWGDSGIATGTYKITGTAGSPVFDVPAGTYPTAQAVTIRSFPPTASIRYTTDGTPPTATTGIPYTGPILMPLNSVTQIRAIAFATDWIDSAVASAIYAVQATVFPPMFSTQPGTSTGPRTVTLSTPTPGAGIRYTIDGTTPTAATGILATGPIPLPAGTSTVIKAIAYRDGWGESGVVEGTFVNRKPVAVSSGFWASVMLHEDGTVSTWGWNYYGQLGDGTTASRSLPAPVPGLSGVVAVSAGLDFAVALKGDGTVWAWGKNTSGQLGDNTTTNRYAPVQVLGLTDVVAIDAGSAHVLALRSDNTVWAWGSNNSGELGDGTSQGRIVPVQVQGLSGTTAISAGSYYSLALQDDGTVWGWGRNPTGQLGDGTTTNRYLPVQAGLSNVVAISAGGSHAVALRSDNTVWVWGDNYYGQLAVLGTLSYRSTPAQVAGISNGARISAGSYHTLVLKSDGSAVSWGGNQDAQLGIGSITYIEKSPVAIPNLSGIEMIAAGYANSLALAADGTLWSWGTNSRGQVGDGTTVTRTLPVAVDARPPKSLSAGVSHSVAVKGDGSVWTWGRNGSGQLGDGTGIDRTSPSRIPGLDNVSSSASGRTHSVALRGDGTVWTWGANDHGQLGDGTNAYRTSPVQVPGLNGIVAVSAGHDHTCALRNDGTVWTWGKNASGQLGDGDTVDRSLPYRVTGVYTTAVSVAAGGSHTVVALVNGLVQAWGANGSGQLGDGTLTGNVIPGGMMGPGSVVAVAAGDAHTVARRSDGTVYAWGDNRYGQLGDGSVANRLSPTAVPGLSNMSTVVAGHFHTIALRSDGVWTWGFNGDGQLGHGDTANRLSPTRLSLLPSDLAAAGLIHTLVLKSDGTLWAWGGNADGELGDGSLNSSYVPKQVAGGDGPAGKPFGIRATGSGTSAADGGGGGCSSSPTGGRNPLSLLLSLGLPGIWFALRRRRNRAR